MLLRRAVSLKVIVTEEFKQSYKNELKAAADQITNSIQQLQFQAERMIADVAKTNLEQAGMLRRQFDVERQKHERTKAEILTELQKAGQLEIDSEFDRGTLEGLVEVNVGDNLEDKLGKSEVLVKDGLVVEIRE